MKIKYILLVIIVLLTAGCDLNKKNNGKNNITQIVEEEVLISKVKWNCEYEPRTLDSQLASDLTAFQVINAAFEGLTRLGLKGEVIPGAAEKWESNGNVWVFHIKKDLKWSNGDQLTAEDFYYGIKRAIDPTTAAEYSYMTYYIKGAQAFNERKVTDFNQVGIKVIDPQTLKIELEKPTSYFATILSFSIFMPLNRKFYELNKDRYAQDSSKMIYNGPWVISEWIHDNKIEFKRNNYYWNNERIKLDELTFLMIKDYSTAVKMYEKNEIDITNIGIENKQDGLTRDEKTFSDGAPFYIELNTSNKILSNKKVRKALAYAIDRKTFVDKIMGDNSRIALGMTPYGIPGKTKTFREDFGAELFKDNNVEEAKKLYELGMKELKLKGKLTLKLVCDNKETTQRYMRNIQEQLKRNLNVEILIEPVNFKTRLEKMISKDYEMLFAGWGPDYNDPLTYMDLWISNGGNNHTGWSNREYDNEIKTAQTATDAAVRMDSLANAEKILVEEMPIIPIFFRSKNYISKPYVKGVVRRAAGADIDFYWTTVEK